MGIRPIYNPLHVQDLMGDVDVILNSNGLNVENPIDVMCIRNKTLTLKFLYNVNP
jgi:hypothetical protein